MIILALLLDALVTSFGPIQAPPAKQPFAIQISAPQQALEAGSGLEIEILLKNTSAEPLDCSGNLSDLTGQDSNVTVDVRDEHGHPLAKRIYPHPELAGGHPILNCTVAPGKTWIMSQSVGRIFDMTRPGKYTIQVSRPISFTDPQAGVVRSNTLTVTIVPPLFSVQISTSSPEVKAGSPVVVNIRLTNTSTRDLGFGAPLPSMTFDRHYTYACESSRGGNVAYYSPVELDAPPLITVKPGESHDEQVAISSACDLSQPAQYRLQVSRYNPNDPKQGLVRSNEISVTVKP